jgi:hypothetical protein
VLRPRACTSTAGGGCRAACGRGTLNLFDYIKLCRDHYEKVGFGADYVDRLFR